MPKMIDMLDRCSPHAVHSAQAMKELPATPSVGVGARLARKRPCGLIGSNAARLDSSASVPFRRAAGVAL